MWVPTYLPPIQLLFILLAIHFFADPFYAGKYTDKPVFFFGDSPGVLWESAERNVTDYIADYTSSRIILNCY